MLNISVLNREFVPSKAILSTSIERRSSLVQFQYRMLFNCINWNQYQSTFEYTDMKRWGTKNLFSHILLSNWFPFSYLLPILDRSCLTQLPPLKASLRDHCYIGRVGKKGAATSVELGTGFLCLSVAGLFIDIIDFRRICTQRCSGNHSYCDLSTKWESS